jgi:hypothetical protein
LKTSNRSTQARPRSFDQLLLTMLMIGSAAMLIVACTADRRPNMQKEGTRSHSTANLNGFGSDPGATDPIGSESSLASYSIDRRWARVPDEMAGGIDAAINWENGEYSWFHGQHLATLGSQSQGHPIAIGSGTELHNIADQGTGQSAFWPGIPQATANQIDAALFWNRNTAYFFVGDQFIKFDQASGSFKTPQKIASTSNSNPWKNLPPSFQEGIDASVNDGLGNILMFKGNEYLRFDRYLGEVLEGPGLIASRWPVMPQEFHQGIDAAMRRGRGKVTLFRDGLNIEVITSEAL